jgi:Uma2 family endonuclease
MATVLQLGPGDHGRPLSFDELMAAYYAGGFRYEIIEGRLYVSPQPNFSHSWIKRKMIQALEAYSQQRPDVINYVVGDARVFVPGRSAVTAPEPDITAYRGVPDRPGVDWRDISPILVVVVLGGEDDEKDLVRNVELYLRLTTIQEYWVIDIREDETRPTMLVHRRVGDAWDISSHGPDESYATDLLPGFVLPITPPMESA